MKKGERHIRSISIINNNIRLVKKMLRIFFVPQGKKKRERTGYFITDHNLMLNRIRIKQPIFTLFLLREFFLDEQH